MDDLKSLMEEISLHHPEGVSMAELENYCKRYMHHYHQQIERQPSRLYGAWGWSEEQRIHCNASICNAFKARNIFVRCFVQRQITGQLG